MDLHWGDAPQKYPVFLVFSWCLISAPSAFLRFSIPSLLMRLHLSPTYGLRQGGDREESPESCGPYSLWVPLCTESKSDRR